MWISEIVCESLKLYANPHCSSRSRHLSGRTRRFRQIYKKKMDKYIKIRRFRLTENKYGGSRGALEERLTKWLAQALKGFSYLCFFIFLSFFIHAVLGKDIKSSKYCWHLRQPRLPAGPLVCGGDDLCQDTSGSSSWSTLFSTTPCNLCTGCLLLGRVKLTDVCLTRLTFSLRVLNK